MCTGYLALKWEYIAIKMLVSNSGGRLIKKSYLSKSKRTHYAAKMDSFSYDIL